MGKAVGVEVAEVVKPIVLDAAHCQFLVVFEGCPKHDVIPA